MLRELGRRLLSLPRRRQSIVREDDNNWIVKFIILLLCALFTASAIAQEAEIQYQEVEKGFILNFTVPVGWKVYSNQPGDIGKPFEIKADQEIEVVWPQVQVASEVVGNSELKYQYFDKQFSLLIVTEADDVNLQLSYGMCKDVCLNKERQINLSKSGTGIWYIAFLAFLGGLILNAMPCVFPILGLKLQKLSTYHRASFEPYFIIAGIFASFAALYAFAIMLTLSGEHFQWGMHFQNPLFLSLLSLVLFGMFVSSFFDVVIPNPFSGLAGLQSRSKYINAVLYGVASVALSTPCTAPLLATALGFALTKSILVQGAIFSAVATGFALPYILCIVLPSLLSFMPRSGKWMVLTKKLLAVPLLITGIWFGMAAYSQVNDAGLQVVDLQLWEEMSNERPVLINVTAKWCITCKYNDHRVLLTQEFLELINKHNIYFVQLDYTHKNDDIAGLISKYKRSGIPFTLMIYKKKATILPELLNISDIELIPNQNEEADF